MTYRPLAFLALIWLLGTLQTRAEENRAGQVSQEELDNLWNDLLCANGQKGYRAVRALPAVPDQALALFKDRLRPPPTTVDAATIDRLIGDLDSGQFAVRQKATQELTRLGHLAGPALRQVLARGPALEVRKRVETLLDPLQAYSLAGEELRLWRATEVLEAIGTAEARRLLERLTQEEYGARLAQEARAGLDRLAKRHVP